MIDTESHGYSIAFLESFTNVITLHYVVQSNTVASLLHVCRCAFHYGLTVIRRVWKLLILTTLLVILNTGNNLKK